LNRQIFFASPDDGWPSSGSGRIKRFAKRSAVRSGVVFAILANFLETLDAGAVRAKLKAEMRSSVRVEPAARC